MIDDMDDNYVFSFRDEWCEYKASSFHMILQQHNIVYSWSLPLRDVEHSPITIFLIFGITLLVLNIDIIVDFGHIL